jgi:hypothetical protein
MTLKREFSRSVTDIEAVLCEDGKTVLIELLDADGGTLGSEYVRLPIVIAEENFNHRQWSNAWRGDR